MTDRPIPFSGPMVRALLDGRKAQTRRVLRPQPDKTPLHRIVVMPDGRMVGKFGTENLQQITLPYSVGDRLWVREALRRQSTDQGVDYVAYDADKQKPWWTGCGWPFKRSYVPPMHMARHYSRLTLTVTHVRVQRVQEISDDAALAEGVELAIRPVAGRDIDIDGQYWSGGPKRMFHQLWDSLNEKRGFGWEANPWVVAISFTVHRQNIDEMGASA